MDLDTVGDNETNTNIDHDNYNDNEEDWGSEASAPRLHKQWRPDTSELAMAMLEQSSHHPQTPVNVLASPAASSTSGGVPILGHFSAALPTPEPTPLSKQEAKLVRHYVEHLGRWLDSTDAARQFTLRVPVQAKRCPILLYAIQCLAARHLGDDATVEATSQRCISLLIERLSLNVATHDENLLCAIVILQTFEQLSLPSTTATDNEPHLAGSAAILRGSHTRTVDPSAPTLREAAFWVYVRQCLFKSTMDQQPPNIDLSLRLHPEPTSLSDHHPLAQLRLETAWANQITWHCACVVHFCFDQNDGRERPSRTQRWDELWDALVRWRRDRPPSFNPIWYGRAPAGSTFPEMLFAADSHGIFPLSHSYGYGIG
jgi:hypothetical protein